MISSIAILKIKVWFGARCLNCVVLSQWTFAPMLNSNCFEIKSQMIVSHAHMFFFDLNMFRNTQLWAKLLKQIELQ